MSNAQVSGVLLVIMKHRSTWNNPILMGKTSNKFVSFSEKLLNLSRNAEFMTIVAVQVTWDQSDSSLPTVLFSSTISELDFPNMKPLPNCRHHYCSCSHLSQHNFPLGSLPGQGSMLPTRRSSWSIWSPHNRGAHFPNLWRSFPQCCFLRSSNFSLNLCVNRAVFGYI